MREEDLIAVDERLDLTDGLVRVRFVCSRCERVTTIPLDPEEWDEGRLLSPTADGPEGEPQAGSGPRLITYAEVREFERLLDSTEQPLAGLLSLKDHEPDPAQENGRARASQEHAD